MLILIYSTHWDHPTRMHIMYMPDTSQYNLIHMLHSYMYISTTYSRLPNYSSHPKNHICFNQNLSTQFFFSCFIAVERRSEGGILEIELHEPDGLCWMWIKPCVKSCQSRLVSHQIRHRHLIFTENTCNDIHLPTLDFAHPC